MDNLSVVYVGDRDNPEYKHQITWENLELSKQKYNTNHVLKILNEDGTIKECQAIYKTAKELIYDELRNVLISIYYIKKDKQELRKLDIVNQRELNHLQNLFKKHIAKDDIMASVYVKQTDAIMKKLQVNQYHNRDFDRTIVNDTYSEILYQIKLKINRIEKKKEKFHVPTIKKHALKKISSILKEDYVYQKEYFKEEKERLENEKVNYDKSFKNTNQLIFDLEKLIENNKSKNLNNYRAKALTFLNDNSLYFDSTHK